MAAPRDTAGAPSRARIPPRWTARPPTQRVTSPRTSSRPVSPMVETFGTGMLSDAELVRIVSEEFDLRPGAIVRDLDLLRPIFQKTAAYGHFGREDHDFTWERTDRVD